MVRRLIKSRANVEYCDVRIGNALQIAACRGHSDGYHGELRPGLQARLVSPGAVPITASPALHQARPGLGMLRRRQLRSAAQLRRASGPPAGLQEAVPAGSNRRGVRQGAGAPRRGQVLRSRTRPLGRLHCRLLVPRADSDRLPAVVGLAQEIARATGATYLAGLWDRNLLRWLCWSVNKYWLAGARGSVSASAKTRDYYAPSWSWGSLHGTPVSLPSTLKSMKPEDIAAKVEAVNISPGTFEYGPPQASSIVLTRPFRRIRVHWEGDMLWVDGADGRAEEVSSLRLDRPDKIPRHGKHELYAICLWSFQNFVGGGLALKKVAGHATFCRVGYLQFSGELNTEYEYLPRGKRQLSR